jgi:histidine triad (HIT) family protein
MMADGKPVADCLICNILAGEIPSTNVRETELTYSFKDIHPQAPTHDLLVPRAHYASAADLAANARTPRPRCWPRPARSPKPRAWPTAATASGFNTGSQAGQAVFHVHAHVLGGDSAHPAAETDPDSGRGGRVNDPSPLAPSRDSWRLPTRRLR